MKNLINTMVCHYFGGLQLGQPPEYLDSKWTGKHSEHGERVLTDF